MSRKNSRALIGGNAPRHGVAKSAREAWLRLVNAVSGTPQEHSARIAAAHTDNELGPQRTDAWYTRAGILYREMTTIS